MKVNSDFVKASTLRLPHYSKIDITVVGLGGTGSWLASSVVRIARSLQELGKPTSITFVDPDIVEALNVSRQCFCDTEIGSNKAFTLALRYSLAWGMNIRAIASPFNHRMVDIRMDTLSIVLGCVDNAATRREISEVLTDQWSFDGLHKVWYIDCGNSRSSGQVLIGSLNSREPGGYKFAPIGCTRLPSPTIQHPELLLPLPEELTDNNLSCEQLAAVNTQNLDVNQYVASIATSYLLKLTTGNLKQFATYFDTEAGSCRSVYITQKNVLKALS